MNEKEQVPTHAVFEKIRFPGCVSVLRLPLTENAKMAFSLLIDGRLDDENKNIMKNQLMNHLHDYFLHWNHDGWEIVDMCAFAEENE